jgi:hypothetical protein
MSPKLLVTLGILVVVAAFAIALAVVPWRSRSFPAGSTASAAASISEQRYAGDGRLVDHGPNAAIRRYVVDLGTIDLATEGSRTFSMAGLPREEFVVGLQVHALTAPASVLYDVRPLRPVVRLEIFDARDASIFVEELPLHEWTWSGRSGERSDAFVYVRGDERVLADRRADGPCSCFVSSSGGRYRARFTVVRPEPTAPGYEVVAQAFGGGWK